MILHQSASFPVAARYPVTIIVTAQQMPSIIRAVWELILITVVAQVPINASEGFALNITSDSIRSAMNFLNVLVIRMLLSLLPIFGGLISVPFCLLNFFFCLVLIKV